MIPLRIEARSPLTEIRISDARFRDVGPEANTGLVETLLPRGVYQVSFREGRALQTELVLLTAGAAGPITVNQPADATRSAARRSDEDAQYESVIDPDIALQPGYSLVTVSFQPECYADFALLQPELPEITL